MNIRDNIHPDWYLIMNLFNQEPLSTLFYDILPNISYKPEKEKIFSVFKMPMKDIKVVILQSEPYPYVTNTLRDFKEWEDQGVFILNTSLTSEVGNVGAHYEYWEKLIQTVIFYISKYQPCIWMIPNINNEIKFKKHILNPFTVEGYDRELIENIPINPDFNYIFTKPNVEIEEYKEYGSSTYNFYYVNSILKNKSLNEIKWNNEI